MSLATSIFDNKVFQGRLSDNLQALITNNLDTLYGASVYRQYIQWSPIERTELNFDVLIGTKRMAAAASIVDKGSPTPVRSRGSLNRFTGKIPQMGHKYHLDEDDYRALDSLINDPRLTPTAQKLAVKKLLQDDATDALNGMDWRMDILFLQSVFTFSMDLTVTGNPDGAAMGNVPLPVEANQTRGVAKVWTDPTSDPFADIEAMVENGVGRGQTYSEIWIDRSKWLQIKNYDKVRSAVGGYLNVGSGKNFVVTQDSINEYLQANGLPTFKLWNIRRNIESDGKQQLINPIDPDNVAFVVDSSLGTIEHAYHIEDREPVPEISYAKYDQFLLKKFRESNPWQEWTETVVNAIPVVDVSKIALLKTDTVQA